MDGRLTYKYILEAMTGNLDDIYRVLYVNMKVDATQTRMRYMYKKSPVATPGGVVGYPSYDPF